ncbi:PREDICTED: probable protein phosphatase 2C 55 [Camelina sativa]|uniref:Protein phosphatase n=1 Tax=Camelina sativa TaxID=90675 RepID=A0ABM0V2C0_CAMSA|nr:PREDICTED: probable protein phosphatase 2C 55 [Camelina sativa]
MLTVREGLQKQVKILIGLANLGFGSYRGLHSRFTNPNGFLEPASSDLLLINERRNLSVVGAVSRTFSVPSVSGPAFQVCGYHIDLLLSDPSSLAQGKSMASLGSKSLFADRHSDLLVSKRFGVGMVCGDGPNRGRISMRLRGKDHSEKSTIYAYFAYRGAKRWIYMNHQRKGLGFRGLHSSLSNRLSAGNAPDVSLDNSVTEEEVRDSSDSVAAKLCTKPLKLVSGSCYLPHPDKEATGGEDAHFICAEEQALGVADGVGGWAELGIDAGFYSRELMSNSVNAIQDEPKGSIDPARVLEKAHTSTKSLGSSTACIIALTNQGLNAINLGDSGFMVVREGHTVFRSPVQQHDFNFTYQLESGRNGDLPSSGQVFTFAVAPGDVIIAGTDGLFDNLYNNEITAIVVHAVRANIDPQVTAQKIAALARQRAQDKNRQTPFSTAAQDAGFRYYGGKLDDITVVVSYVAASKEEGQR